MNLYFRPLCLLTLVLLPFSGQAQFRTRDSLRADIRKIIDTAQAHVGVGVLGLDFRDSLAIHGDDRFPMQSVFKFPLAIAVLHQVDQGHLSLTQKIHLSRESLDTATWSPLAKRARHRAIDISLRELLAYTVSQSDNNGCDALFRLIGDPRVVSDYLHGLGLRGIALTATEADMSKNWLVQYTNWCQPAAMLQLLRRFYQGLLLSQNSRDLLMKLMTESTNSSRRIKGLLPPAAVVAHKTGTSDTNDKGITAATNDIGIVTLPDGRHLALVVLVSDYPGGVERGEHMIAAIARLVWDYYTSP